MTSDLSIHAPIEKPVSLIVCTCDNSQFISNTFDSILMQTIQPDEIILIHQGKSFDKLRESALTLFPQATIIHDNLYGLSRARNIAYSNSKFDWLAYTDDDVILTPNWVEEIKKSIAKNPEIGILGGKISPIYSQKNPNFSLPPEWEYCLPAYVKDYEYGPYKGNDLPAGANLVISKDVFKRIGLFKLDLGLNAGNKQQIYGEDSYFCQTAKDAGIKIFYNPNLIVNHPVPIERQSYSYIKNRLINEGYTKSYILFNYTKKGRVKIFKHMRKITGSLIRSAVRKDLNTYVAFGQIKYLAKNFRHILMPKLSTL